MPQGTLSDFEVALKLAEDELGRAAIVVSDRQVRQSWSKYIQFSLLTSLADDQKYQRGCTHRCPTIV